MKEQQRRS